MEKLLYRAEEAALVLGMSRAKLYLEIAAGRIAVIHIGRAARIPADELHAYVERAKTEAGWTRPT